MAKWSSVLARTRSPGAGKARLRVTGPSTAGSWPVAQGIHQQGKSRRWLAATWVVEVIARPGRTPIVKHPQEAPPVEMGRREVLGDIGKAETIQGGVEDFEDVVQDDLAVDPHLEFAAVSFEIPRPEPAMGGKAQVD